jgi:pyruvate decarboxylase
MRCPTPLESSSSGFLVGHWLICVGYAADGYARVKGMGAVITTFGVGELSAINAIGGSYSEFVPVVHIVGTPSTSSQRDGRALHHSLGDGNFNVFAVIYKAVTVAQADLLDPFTAPREIDRVLRTCWIKSRPVHIQIPTDMVHKIVDASALRQPIDRSLPVDNDIEQDVVSRILAELYASKRPCILVDGFRFRPQVGLLIYDHCALHHIDPCNLACHRHQSLCPLLKATELRIAYV